MDAAHVHLLINHIPILGSIFGALLLIIGLVLKNRSVEVTALVTLVVVALMTIPAYVSGEEAEHIIEHLEGISEYELEEHEEHAELSLWLMMGTGVLAVLSLIAYRGKRTLRKVAMALTFFAAFLTFLSMIPLGLHGGQIIRSELLDDASEAEHEHEHHDHEEEEDH